MRFRVIDKILLVFLIILTVAFAAVMIGIALNLITAQMLLSVATLAGSSIIVSLCAALIGIVLLVIAFRLIGAMANPPAPAMPTSALLLNTEVGAAYISLAAIDSMVQRHCRANQVVKDCESLVQPVEGGVRISLKLNVQNDTVAPVAVPDIQQSLKAYVEGLSGISVKEITVLIVNTPLPSRPSAI